LDDRESYDRRKAEVLAIAPRVFASEIKASSWIIKAKRGFNHRSPLDMLETAEGTLLVKEMLLQLDNGFVH